MQLLKGTKQNREQEVAEMSKEELAKRFLATMGEIHNYKIRNSKVTVDDLERMARVVNSFNGDLSVDDDATMTIYDLVGKAVLLE